MTPCYESEDGDDRDRSEVHVTDGKGREIHLGHFADESDAARAYDAVAPIYHGDFARLNFP